MSLKSIFYNLVSHWGNWSLHHPFRVLLCVALLTALGIQYTATHLSINTDTAELIAPEAPFQQNRRNFEKAFGQDLHTLLLVVESETPELTKLTTKRLSRLLNTEKATIKNVYVPNDNTFFQNNGLLFLDGVDLENLSGTISEAQPFIGRISQEPHLKGFFSVFEDALISPDKTQDLPIDLPSLIDKVSTTLRKTVNGENTLLSWENLIAKTTISGNNANRGFILVLPEFDYTKIRPAEDAINSIRSAIVKVQDRNLPPVKIWVTGEVGLEDDELLGMSSGTFNASIFSAVIVCVILLIAYRSVLFTLATFITLAIGMVFCGVFAAWSVQDLNLISVAFAVSNIGLGVEYAIHFCLRYRDNLLHHIQPERALHSTLMSTSPSLLLCAGTTAIGLYAFIPTDYQGVSELGLLAGTSLFICLLITLTALPILLKFIPASLSTLISNQEPSHNWFSTLSEKLARFTLHYAKAITLATAILTMVSIGLAFSVQTDFNPINLRDPNTESVIAFKKLIQDPETSPMTLTILSKSAEETKALQQKLKAIKSVDKSVSLFDLIPANQEEKIAVIEEMSMLMGSQRQSFPPLQNDVDPTESILHLIKAIDTTLPTKTDSHEISSLIAFKQTLQDLLLELKTRLEPDRAQFVATIQTALLGTLPKVMNDLLNGFNAKSFGLDDLPADLKERWLSRDGWYRIQIYPKYDLNDLTRLEEFITDVQQVAPNTTDLPIMYWESMKEVLAAFQQAIIIALITIATLLLVIRRSIVDTLLVMTPLILAGLFTMASTVLTGTPINFANIIALPLLLGLGVDNGIHMVEKLHHSLTEKQNIYRSSTARAMFYGALTTASSFAGLAFSPHEGIASMGLIITMGIFWIMTCTFIILPALSKLVLKGVPND